MAEATLVGKAQTVHGLVDPGVLGITSAHEHILSDMSAYFQEPEKPSEKHLADRPLSLDIIGWCRAHRFSNHDNARLNDPGLAIPEVLRFKDAGGDTIVEMSQHGMNRDPAGLAQIAQATGLNIVMGSGYYLGMSHPLGMDEKTEEQIADEIIADILEGADGTGIKAGLIGEIGCSVPLMANERKVLRAAAAAQRHTGAPMDIHPGFSDASALEIIAILQDAGASLDRTMISHVENFDYTLDTRLRILESGCFVGYDNFGNLGYPHCYLGRVINLTTDLHRIRDIKELIDRGFLSQILLGQDLCFKDMYSCYGGYGYGHLLENAVPLMRDMGLMEAEIDTLLVDNPRRFLTFGEPVG
jgi:phosphotriesterase-related protein